MEYYSAIKKHEIMPFAATWLDLEIIILSEVRQRKTNITDMRNLIKMIQQNLQREKTKDFNIRIMFTKW